MPGIAKSGGAKGADAAWGAAAFAAGHLITHYSFDEHKVHSSIRPSFVCRLSDQALKLHDDALAEVGKQLHRPWPPRNSFVKKLLQRDYYQVEGSKSLYAVGYTPMHAKDMPKRPLVGPALAIMGGTAWACQLFVNRFIRGLPADFEGEVPIPFYFYQQNFQRWIQLWVRKASPEEGRSEMLGLWGTKAPLHEWRVRWVSIGLPPYPSGVYTAIGSRDLMECGRQAILSVYTQDPPSDAPALPPIAPEEPFLSPEL